MERDPHYAPHPREEVEAWFRHTADEGRPQEEHAAQVDVRALTVAFFLITAAFIVLVVALIMYYYSYVAQQRQARMETTAPAQEWYDYQRATRGRLQGSYSWVDPAGESDAVQVPLELAIERVVEYYAGRGEE